MVMNIECKQCGGEMMEDLKKDISIGLQIVGVLLFTIGMILLFFIPIGTIIGIIVMICAARLGFKKTKVWRCKKCGYFFERV